MDKETHALRERVMDALSDAIQSGADLDQCLALVVNSLPPEAGEAVQELLARHSVRIAYARLLIAGHPVAVRVHRNQMSMLGGELRTVAESVVAAPTPESLSYLGTVLEQMDALEHAVIKECL